MNFSRRFLLGLLALGVQAGLASALEPTPDSNLFSRPTTAPLTEAVFPQLPPAADAHGDNACAGSHCGVIGGVGLYLIQPYFENNPSYNILLETHSGTSTPTAVAVDRVNVSHHVEVAPLVWLGYANEDGFGGRARWWYFRQGSSQNISLPPFTGNFTIKGTDVIQTSGTLATVTSATPLGLQAFGDTLSRMHGPEATSFTITTKLEVQVADLEVFQDYRCASWDFLLSGGVRLARIEQTYNAYDSQSTSAAELRTLLSSYNFQGVGPVLALEIRRALGECGLTAYGSARGSVVIGSAQQNSSFGGQELRNEDPNPQFASQHWNRGVPIGELELGLEYGKIVGPSRLFGQVALVGQDWFGAGSASRSTPLTAQHSPNPTNGGAAIDSDISFFGVSFRIGLNY